MRQGALFDEPKRPSLHPSARAEGATSFVPLSALDAPPASVTPPGIARLAAEAPEIDFRNDVEYYELPCRSLVSRCDSPRVPFEYTINPYRGCECGCSYCYARYTHEFMELQDPRDFERKIFVKRGARDALVRDLRRLDLRGQSIAIGTATDPYQPAERRFGVTRALLELFAGRRGLRLSITTKSDLILRDLDLLRRVAERNELHVNVTITTPHYTLAHRLEPRAPRPDKRLSAVAALSSAGLAAGVFLMPVMPYINDIPEDLELLIRRASEAGAAYLFAGVLFLRASARKHFFPFLQEHFPALLPHYQCLYAGRSPAALRAYSKAKLAEVEALKVRHGLTENRRREGRPTLAPDQLVLAEW